MHTYIRLGLIALAIAALMYWLSGTPVNGWLNGAQAAELVAPQTVAGYEPLDCSRAAVHGKRGASYQMDGPLGMASDAEISKWVAMSHEEQVLFWGVCNGANGS